jgi:5'-3' exoribonuclease 1
MVLNPNYLYQETFPWVPPFMAEEPQEFQLGDRVINIRSNDVKFVPFGEKGTITAITDEFFEVMFDNEFVGGSTMEGRFTTRKGAYVKPENILNLTK